jgi:hypothetical protein
LKQRFPTARAASDNTIEAVNAKALKHQFLSWNQNFPNSINQRNFPIFIPISKFHHLKLKTKESFIT